LKKNPRIDSTSATFAATVAGSPVDARAAAQVVARRLSSLERIRAARSDSATASRTGSAPVHFGYI